jgi:endogenous inhibitor of DNA gyrase (YacG/DUF329 family)
MKSKLQDPQIKTNCKTCQCAIYENKTQKGCSFKRIQKFGDNVIEAYDDEKEFYIIKRFCNYFRNQNWNNGVLDLEKIKHESSVSFDIIIDCSNLDTDIDTESVIQILSDMNYYANKVNITLLHLISCDKNIRKNIFKVFCSQKCQIVETIDLNEYLHSFAISSKSTYHIMVDISNKSELLKLYKLNDVINDDIKQAIVFNINTARAISNIVYRIESFSNEQYDYKVNVSSIVKKSLESNLSIDIYD